MMKKKNEIRKRSYATYKDFTKKVNVVQSEKLDMLKGETVVEAFTKESDNKGVVKLVIKFVYKFVPQLKKK